MKAIGGYFELELRKGEEYHKNAIKLNTGRNALELILNVKQYKKVYLPYYTCDAILEPFNKLKIDYEFYSINEVLEPLFNYNNIKGNEGFLYTNYFGLKDFFISSLSAKCINLIIDNSQAFFSKPISNIPTFYSCRKFFGVPDGSYLYLDGLSEYNFPQDYSLDRLIHLIKRIEFGAEEGYNDFISNEKCLIGKPIMQMSKLTEALMCNIDYESVRTKRIENFLIIHETLRKYNALEVKPELEFAPMLYPFLTYNTNVKKHLIENKIFVPTFWPNVFKLCNEKSLEYSFFKYLIPVPIDQRYSKSEIECVVKMIKGAI